MGKFKPIDLPTEVPVNPEENQDSQTDAVQQSIQDKVFEIIKDETKKHKFKETYVDLQKIVYDMKTSTGMFYRVAGVFDKFYPGFKETSMKIESLLDSYKRVIASFDNKIVKAAEVKVTAKFTEECEHKLSNLFMSIMEGEKKKFDEYLDYVHNEVERHSKEIKNMTENKGVWLSHKTTAWLGCIFLINVILVIVFLIVWVRSLVVR